MRLDGLPGLNSHRPERQRVFLQVDEAARDALRELGLAARHSGVMRGAAPNEPKKWLRGHLLCAGLLEPRVFDHVLWMVNTK